MARRVCCICGKFEKKSKGSLSFFSFPKKSGLLRTNEIQLVERRISAWNAILGPYLNRYHGIQCVCSDHFHSGKPSYLYYENDVDWVPSKNLSNLQQHEDSGIENVADCSLQEATECCIDPARPMVTIVNPQLLFNPSFSENPSTAVQCSLDDNNITVKQELMDVEDFEDKACALDDNSITVKQEIMDIEDFEDKAPMNIDPNLSDFLNSTSTAECGTQVDFDEPPRPIQLDKSTQTQMSSFLKSHEIQKSKKKK